MIKLLVFFTGLIYVNNSFSGEIAPLKDGRLTHFISSNKILAESGDPEMFSVKLMVEHFFADCGNPRPNCPKDKLFISTYVFGIPSNTYYIGDGYFWKFVRWDKPPEVNPTHGGTQDIAIFVINRDVNKNGKYSSQKILVKVTPNSLSVEE
jgi:hypothetical protein